VPAKDVFAKPEALDFPEAANLLLAACTAADMLRVSAGRAGPDRGRPRRVGSGRRQPAPAARAARRARDRHGVGAQLRLVRRFGGEPVAYGDGLEARPARARADRRPPFDCVGTDEAVDTSLALVGKDRPVTVAAQGRAQQDGFARSAA
jgi:hypothetical protein